MKKDEIMFLACQVGAFQLTLSQIMSEMNCTWLRTNICPKSHKLLTRDAESGKLMAISLRVTKSNNIVCTHYVKVFCILCFCIIL